MAWASVTLNPMPDGEVRLVAEMNQRLQIDENARLRMSVDAIIERWRSWVEEGYHCLIARRNREVVGYLIYIEETDPCPGGDRMVYLRQLYVEREHRRQGIGRAMVERFVRDHLPAGVAVEMDVLCSNPAGRAFWEAVGFAPRLTRMRREG